AAGAVPQPPRRKPIRITHAIEYRVMFHLHEMFEIHWLARFGRSVTLSDLNVTTASRARMEKASIQVFGCDSKPRLLRKIRQ
ncbi:MAG: hypothetical protein P8J88_07355, partial [Phycisphaerales bacterium]|nr:hypothetical protein [Phycisphaerales bacterium]